MKPRADADQRQLTPPHSTPLPPPPGSVSTHLARFVGERDMYMRNYIVDFPGGGSCSSKGGREKEQVQSACGTLLSCSTALLRFWPGHCGGFFYSIFSSYFFSFFVTFLPLPFCTFGQRSRRTPAWTRIGNNLLCLTAGMYVCVTARPHAHECIILTFAWRVSWPRCFFRPFGISLTLFFCHILSG